MKELKPEEVVALGCYWVRCPDLPDIIVNVRRGKGILDLAYPLEVALFRTQETYPMSKFRGCVFCGPIPNPWEPVR